MTTTLPLNLRALHLAPGGAFCAGCLLALVGQFAELLSLLVWFSLLLHDRTSSEGDSRWPHTRGNWYFAVGCREFRVRCFFLG